MLNLGQLNTINAYIVNGQFEAMDEYLNHIYGGQKVGRFELPVKPEIARVVRAVGGEKNTNVCSKTIYG